MSATVEFFEQDFIVGQYECDCNGRMKAGALMAQSQAISTNHCNELGLTIDVYRRTHTVFLLAKASLEIYHDIKVGDKLRVVTRPSGPKRAIYNRYTSFINEQGIEVAAQDSKWVLVDTDTRKILRDPPEDLDFPFRIQEIPEQDLSIPKVRDAQQTAAERVTYSRTDDNGHLNNTQYADIILDNLPFSATVERRLKSWSSTITARPRWARSWRFCARSSGRATALRRERWDITSPARRTTAKSALRRWPALYKERIRGGFPFTDFYAAEIGMRIEYDLLV